jgi:hypothetical protein
MTTKRQRSDGLGRLLVTIYGLFALAAGARSLVQITTKFGDAPLAYLLSALAAALYLVAAISLSHPSAVTWRTAVVVLAIELAGVLLVGTASIVFADQFPDATVWSDYGIGYGLIPLVLPIAGLLWLLNSGTRRGFEHPDD